MGATKAAAKTIKATTRTRQVQEDNVPAELRGMYDRDNRDEEVSLDFTSETTEDEGPEERETLFTVDGVAYTIPVEFGPGVGLIYLDRISEGRDVALGEILKTVIGTKGWAALMVLAEKNRITGAQFRAIMKKVSDRTMGAMEGIEGN